MAIEQKHEMCRAFHAKCRLIVDLEDDVPVKTHGKKVRAQRRDDQSAGYGVTQVIASWSQGLRIVAI